MAVMAIAELGSSTSSGSEAQLLGSRSGVVSL
jgi:hypothetical protein